MKQFSTPGRVFLILICLNDARTSAIHLVSTQSLSKKRDLGQSIQESTKKDLWKTAFKKFEVI